MGRPRCASVDDRRLWNETHNPLVNNANSRKRPLYAMQLFRNGQFTERFRANDQYPDQQQEKSGLHAAPDSSGDSRITSEVQVRAKVILSGFLAGEL